MAYPKMGEITDKFVGQPYDLNSVLSPAKVWEKLDAQSEEVRVFVNGLVDLLNSTGEDNWLYVAIVNAILGQITDGSLTDVKLSDEEGQIKDRLATHSSNNIKHAPDAIGATGQALVVNAGATATEWKDVTDGAWVKIAEQTLVSAVAQIDFSSIPSGYKNLRLMFDAVKDTTTVAGLELIFNDDVAANYRYQQFYAVGANTAALGVVGATKILLERALPDSSYTHSFGMIEISNFISSKTKRVIAEWYAEGGTEASNLYKYTLGGIWTNTLAEISKISLKASAGNIGISSRFVLWGCK